MEWFDGAERVETFLGCEYLRLQAELGRLTRWELCLSVEGTWIKPTGSYVRVTCLRIESGYGVSAVMRLPVDGSTVAAVLLRGLRASESESPFTLAEEDILIRPTIGKTARLETFTFRGSGLHLCLP